MKLSGFVAETDGTAKKLYRLVPHIGSTGFYTVPYRYRRGFAVYRLAKYRTAKIFLDLLKLQSNL
jgi:hypothetical protein